MTNRPKEMSHKEYPLTGGSSPPSPGACTATTQYGRPCQNLAQPDNEVCWSHNPANAEARARNARAGGVAVHSPTTLEIQELKHELKSLIREVKEGKVAPGVATVVTQLANVLLRGIEQERKVRETEELEERIAHLEGKEGSEWAA
jgi:hypothetical protein